MSTLADQFALAVSCQQTGRLPQAEQLYRQLLQTYPAQAEVHNNLGGVLLDQGRFPDAIGCFQEALRLKPAFALAHNGLGFALEKSNQFSQAIRSYEQALHLKPGFAEAWYNLGNVLAKVNNWEDAATAYRQALQFKPHDAHTLNNLGIALAAQHQWDEAERCHLEILRLHPGDTGALYHLGLALARQGKHDQAIHNFAQSLQARPHDADVCLNLGNSLVHLERMAEAETQYRSILQARPADADAHWNLAHLCLRMGRFEEGWREYEWRSAQSGFIKRHFAQPLWDGADLEGKTILLYADQGLGDTVQFVRYLPLVKHRGGRVAFQCQARLHRILESVPGIDVLIADDAALPPFAVQAPLVSLPRILGTTLTSIPSDIPYLFADERLQESWRHRLVHLEKFKIGIAWQGNPAFAEDHARSIPLMNFASLARIEGVQLVSLQRGPGMNQLKSAQQQFDIKDLRDIDNATGGFMDTAAVMKNLDLVVSSDTAVPHLAGALGVPIWVALAKMPDWRWMLARDDSPWYPTMKLFRQRRAGDWASVFEQIATQVKARMDGLASAAANR